MTKPVVYVVQETDHSLIKASPFGQLQPLWPRGAGLTNSAAGIELRNRLSEVTPLDWLLPVGDPAAIAVAAAEFARLTGTLRLLRWSRQLDAYEPLEFVL